jgi:hypothetical protein
VDEWFGVCCSDEVLGVLRKCVFRGVACISGLACGIATPVSGLVCGIASPVSDLACGVAK